MVSSTPLVVQDQLHSGDDAVTCFSDLANQPVVRFRCIDGSVVKITQNPLIHDSSGGIVWETAYLLAMYMEQRVLPQYKEKPRVLEVGAGCGLLGLVLAHAGCPVVLTEQPSTLPILQTNVAENPVTPPHCEPHAMQLFWGNEEHFAEVAKHGPFRIIVGTDVFFSPSLVEPLLSTIHFLSNADTIVYLCMQERCPDTHRLFLASAPKWYSVEDLTSSIRALPGCGFAEELECLLFCLSKKKSIACPSTQPHLKTSKVGLRTVPNNQKKRKQVHQNRKRKKRPQG